MGLNQRNAAYFDALDIKLESQELQGAIRREAEAAGINFRYFAEHGAPRVGIALNQNTESADVADIVRVFAKVLR